MGEWFQTVTSFLQILLLKKRQQSTCVLQEEKGCLFFFFSFDCIIDMSNFEKMKGQGGRNVSFQHYQCVLLFWALSKTQRALSNLWVQLPWNLLSRYTFSSSLCTKYSKDYFIPETVLHFNILNKRLSTHLGIWSYSGIGCDVQVIDADTIAAEKYP